MSYCQINWSDSSPLNIDHKQKETSNKFKYLQASGYMP